MFTLHHQSIRRIAALRRLWLASGFTAGTLLAGAFAQSASAQLIPNDLLISGSVYDASPSSVPAAGSPLPYGGTSKSDGTYPYVFNNAYADGSFGITTPIFIQQVNPMTNALDATINIPTSVAVTSFSSKSELGLSVSSDGQHVTFSGYAAPDNTIDVSNSNTPGLVDSTNPVTSSFARTAVNLNINGTVTSYNDNAYSGNNQRNVVFNPSTGDYITVGNAGNGSATGAGLDALSANTGVQVFNPATSTLTGGAYNTTVVGAYQNGTSFGNSNGDQYGFSITQLGVAADKTGKDNNFRGETVAPDGSLYITKGSGSNGINTVYHVTVPGGGLPTTANASSASITIAPGFSQVLAKTGKNPDGTVGTSYHPFGLFFANATTLYVTDEGDGNVTFDAATGAITSTTAVNNADGGLEKWSLVNGTWQLDYNLTAGLGLHQTYTIAPSATLGAYPTGNNTSKTGAPQQWAPEVDGLRNVTGQVNADGSVTLYAVTSTISGSGDQGTDPNEVVAITDNLAATSLPTSESFNVVDGAVSGTVYRGVAVVPTPEPGSLGLLIAGAAFLGSFRRRRALISG